MVINPLLVKPSCNLCIIIHQICLTNLCEAAIDASLLLLGLNILYHTLWLFCSALLWLSPPFALSFFLPWCVRSYSQSCSDSMPAHARRAFDRGCSDIIQSVCLVLCVCISDEIAMKQACKSVNKNWNEAQHHFMDKENMEIHYCNEHDLNIVHSTASIHNETRRCYWVRKVLWASITYFSLLSCLFNKWSYSLCIWGG